jgi:hypothetical protein
VKTQTLLSFFTQKQIEWYGGHSSLGLHDAHKSQWNIHSGYWSFESGSLKDTQYYPYDMVHWEDL